MSYQPYPLDPLNPTAGTYHPLTGAKIADELLRRHKSRTVLGLTHITPWPTIDDEALLTQLDVLSAEEAACAKIIPSRATTLACTRLGALNVPHVLPEEV